MPGDSDMFGPKEFAKKANTSSPGVLGDIGVKPENDWVGLLVTR
jgi:hypothetical protein